MADLASFANCHLTQEPSGDGYVYTVMASQGAVFASTSLVRAYEYAEWFQKTVGRGSVHTEREVSSGDPETVPNGVLPSPAEADHVRVLVDALQAILREPYGCPFCDSGKLRNPAKGHTDTCGYGLAQAALGSEAA